MRATTAIPYGRTSGRGGAGFSTVRAGAVLLLPLLAGVLLLVGGVGYMVGSALSLGHLLE